MEYPEFQTGIFGRMDLVWSRATVRIENIREGSSVIRQFVALSVVALSRHRHHTRYLKEVFGLKFRTVSIPTFIFVYFLLTNVQLSRSKATAV